MRRVIEETGAGLIVDTSDPAAIAAAVNQILGDSARHDEMSEKARTARAHYSWEQEEHLLVELYAGLA